MKIYNLILAILGLVLVFSACDDDDFSEAPPQFPRINIDAATTNEESDTGAVQMRVYLTWAFDETVSVRYSTETTDTDNADPGKDYEAQTAVLVEFAPGETEQFISIPVIDDPFNESIETFTVKLENATNGQILRGTAKATIISADQGFVVDDEGYSTPRERLGFDLVWEEEFDQAEIDTDTWTHEIGNGANGWGNNELQYYTDRPNNSFLAQNNYLVIEAREESESGFDYTSARMISMDKQEFQYGRIDIRAKLPEGRGLWPALWMLGQDFPEIGWPQCGEIDIMEIVGHQTQILYGTAHFPGAGGAPASNGNTTFVPGSERFSDVFHVFSINWQEDRIEWLLDDVVYHTITPDNFGGSEWPFNDAFFFILNVAVGGNFPGSPDDNTVFPQRMIVDYIRVFQ